jgi:hypothetical protein
MASVISAPPVCEIRIDHEYPSRPTTRPATNEAATQPEARQASSPP